MVSDAQLIHDFIKEVFSVLFGEFSWIFAVAFFAYGFKNIITEIIEGMLFYYDGNIKVNDIIYLDGTRKARITKKGFMKTSMYLYSGKGKPNRMVIIPNTRLKYFMIEKPLDENGDETDENK